MDQDSTEREKVSRKRRFRFIAATVAFCLSSATLFTGLAAIGWIEDHTSLVELYVEAMIGLSTALGLAYVTGSVVDYNGGVMNALGLRSRADATGTQAPRERRYAGVPTGAEGRG